MINEIISWIYDRIQQGANEEIGSMDSVNIEGVDVEISVSDENARGVKLFDVIIDGVFYHQLTFSELDTDEFIEHEVRKFLAEFEIAA